MMFHQFSIECKMNWFYLQVQDIRTRTLYISQEEMNKIERTSKKKETLIENKKNRKRRT